ncbi:MAG: FmdB family zinc ribbon protein [Chloroflexota bacterium]|nr:hypothetical protein [Chloroflexota bacterium]
MPTYDYQCGTCEHRFEKYQGFHDEPIKICPECGNEVRKVFSAAGIIFKGSGWYINDSRKGSKTEAKSLTSKTEAKNDSSTNETKTDSTKTETKAEGSKTEAKTDSSKTSKAEAAA